MAWLLPRFVAAAKANQPLEVYGDGKQTGCFCHVLDVVDAALTALMANPKSSGQVFNLGSDQEISIEDLAKKVILVTSSQRVRFATSPISRHTARISTTSPAACPNWTSCGFAHFVYAAL